MLALFSFIAYPLLIRDSQTNQEATPSISEPSQLIPKTADTQTTDFVEVQGEEGLASEATQKAAIERVTRLVVERLGSYSNFSGDENINTLQNVMTSSMYDYAEKFINDDLRDKTGYYGVTTQIIGLNIEEFSAKTSAKVNVIVKQSAQSGFDADLQLTDKTGTVDLIYNDDEWLVNGVYYQ